MSDLPIPFGDVAEIPGTSPAGLTIMATIILHPVLGFMALDFVLTQRLRHSIAAPALPALAEWVCDMPSVIRQGAVSARPPSRPLPSPSS